MRRTWTAASWPFSADTWGDSMTKVILLEQLSEFAKEAVRELLLPVQPTEEVPAPEARVAEVYFPCLPDLRDYESKTPFITNEIVTGKDRVETEVPGVRRPRSTTVVRTCFCVYHKNEQEGKLALLNLMERLRIALEEQVVVGRQFTLDLNAGVETLVYPTIPGQPTVRPFYFGEMITTWRLPTIERIISHE